MTRSSPFLLLIAASGLAHLVGAGGAWVYLTGEEPAVTEKASIRVALGSRGASAGQPVEADIQAQPEEISVPAPRPAPKPVQPVEPKPQPVAEPTVELETIPDEVVADAEPEPAQTASQPKTVLGNAGVTGTSTEGDIDTGGDETEAGYQAMLTSYDGLVLGHLSGFKTFPPGARMRGEEGIVGVEFVIDRKGSLSECRLLASSGSRRLDKAAMRQLRSAVPYPAAPAQADWSRRTYRTSMRYSLN